MEYTTRQLCESSIIAKWFGVTEQNINKTYRAKKKQSFNVIDIGSYAMEHNISKDEMILAIEIIKKLRTVYAKEI